MPRFLESCTQISAELERMIEGCEDKLYIVSPYLKINNRIRDLLHDAIERGVKPIFIYGKNELQESENKYLGDLFKNGKILLYFLKNLHAKCYANEKQCVFTSMNLYDYSQVTNEEMGITFYNSEEEYTRIITKIKRYISLSVVFSEKVESEKHRSDEKSGFIPRIAFSGVGKRKVPEEPDTGVVPHVKFANIVNEPTQVIPVLNDSKKLTTAKLAAFQGMDSRTMYDVLSSLGYLFKNSHNKYELSEQGREVGGEMKIGKYGVFFLWPPNLSLN